MSRRSEDGGRRATAERVDFPGALRDAGFTALIAFGLLLPLIGFQTVTNISNDLILTTRWPLLLTVVAVIAAGRFLYSFAIAPWVARRAQRPAQRCAAALAHLSE